MPKGPGLGPFRFVMSHRVGAKRKPEARAPVAGDVRESPLRGLSRLVEVGGEGLVTHFSFRFCYPPEADQRYKRGRKTFF